MSDEPLEPGDDHLLAAIGVAAFWIVVCGFAAVVLLVAQHIAASGQHGELARTIAEEPGQGGWPERIGIVLGALICATPGFVLIVRVLKLRRTPLARVKVTITAAEKWGIGVTKLEVVDANGKAMTLVPRMKAFLESTGGGLKPGVIGIASVRGDQLTDWHTLDAPQRSGSLRS